jgi:hypothetical protein
MRVQEPGNLNRHFFAAPRGARDERRLGDVVCQREAHAAKHLDTLRDGVDELALLLMMLVEQHVQLVQGSRSRRVDGGVRHDFSRTITPDEGRRIHQTKVLARTLR